MKNFFEKIFLDKGILIGHNKKNEKNYHAGQPEKPDFPVRTDEWFLSAPCPCGTILTRYCGTGGWGFYAIRPPGAGKRGNTFLKRSMAGET
jgi:hypothetical protein